MEKLQNTVRHYDWGATRGIPEILGVEPDGRPWAELWIGAHPATPSHVEDGRGLDAVIAADPDAALGQASRAVFGDRLPFLLKILAAGKALSIQAHPSLDQAREGFAREEAAGIPVDASHRNYKDAWHKPELIHALTDFTALCGYRPVAEIRADIARLRTLLAEAPRAPGSTPVPTDDAALLDAALLDAWDAVFAPVYSGADADSAGAALLAATRHVLSGTGYGDLVGRLGELPEVTARRAGTTEDPADDLLDLLALLTGDFPGDPGVLVGLMLQVHHLRPGQSLALDAGVPHAYVRGLGVEIMASSDNVLRGGLTGKHIDLDELDRVLVPTGADGGPVSPDAAGVVRGATDDFALQRIDSATDTPVRRSGASILLAVEGEWTVSSGTAQVTLGAGGSVFVAASEATPHVTGSGALFVASTGL
ncbi:mannose-6-phosphate isomerase, class I [Brevibacterium litoralis]|uniref:mannose-6-phosphate isomerase, class I n=1 Tax=Brevibacterium litoralis TaxID=3138935 RepID=UPI0032EEFDDB